MGVGGRRDPPGRALHLGSQPGRARSDLERRDDGRCCAGLRPRLRARVPRRLRGGCRSRNPSRRHRARHDRGLPSPRRHLGATAVPEVGDRRSARAASRLGGRSSAPRAHRPAELGVHLVPPGRHEVGDRPAAGTDRGDTRARHGLPRHRVHRPGRGLPAGAGQGDRPGRRDPGPDRIELARRAEQAAGRHRAGPGPRRGRAGPRQRQAGGPRCWSTRPPCQPRPSSPT